MSCIYPNRQNFIHLKQRDAVCTQAGEGRGRQGEKALNRHYFPRMETVGDVLGLRSTWLGEGFV